MREKNGDMALIIDFKKKAMKIIYVMEITIINKKKQKIIRT
jgi:hypothetical protein